VSRVEIIQRNGSWWVCFGAGLDGPYDDAVRAEGKANWITKELDSYDSGEHNLLRLSKPLSTPMKGNALGDTPEAVRSSYSGLSEDVGLSKTRAMMSRKALAAERKRKKKLPYISSVCAEPDCRASTLRGCKGKPPKFCELHRVVGGAASEAKEHR
jgi:hypothetical protein